MKTKYPPNKIKLLIAALGLTAMGLSSSLAVDQFVNVCKTSTNAWSQGFWNIQNSGTAYANTTGANTSPGVLAAGRTAAWYHSASTLVAGQGWGMQCVDGTMAGDGQNVVYLVEYAQPSSNGSVDLLMALSSTNATIGDPWTGAQIANGGTTGAFRNTNSINTPNWGKICYVTNNVGVTKPALEVKYVSGANNRSYIDSVRWTRIGDPCQAIPAVYVNAPYITNVASITVRGVTNSAFPGATTVTVYKKVGTTVTMIGQITSGIVDGANVVPLTQPLESGCYMAVTQTGTNAAGAVTESCVDFKYAVGSGPNVAVKLSLNMGNGNSAPLAGPIGEGGASGGKMFFMPGVPTSNAGNPLAGITIQPSACWQTIDIDPRTAPRGDYWAGGSTGAPTLDGFAALRDFCFSMAGNESGPFEIYVDNLANGATLVQDWETAFASASNAGADEADVKNYGGYWDRFSMVGSTYSMLNSSPQSVAISCSTNTSKPMQVAGGTNAQYVSWQWNAFSPNMWIRLVNNAPSNSWVSYPQMDMSKPIHFDLLLAPAGSTPHSVGKVSWLEDTTVCGNTGGTIGIYATPPTDPATGLPMARTYTYTWTKNGTVLSGQTSSNLVVTASGLYEVTVNDSVCSLKRSCNVSFDPGASWASTGATPMPAYLQVEKLGDNAIIGGSSGILAEPTCGLGSDAITYKWIRNGTVDLGAGQSLNPGTRLVISSAASTDSGTYTCVATTAYGSVTSTPCILYFGGAGTATPGDGLKGDYYNAPAAPPTVANAMSGTPTLSRVDNADLASGMQFNWSTNSPDPAVQVDNFLVRWRGTVMPPVNGAYYFRMASDDGSRLWIKPGADWVQCINIWSAHSNQTNGSASGSGYALTAGQHVPIMIEYFEQGSDARFQLFWGCSNHNAGTWATVEGLLPGSTYPGAVISNYQLFSATADFVKPVVHLTAPTGTSGGTQPYAATLTATVTANDGAITRVEFLTNGVSFATNTVAPYTRSVTLNAGSYTIKARVYYNDTWYEDSAETATVNVINVLPVVITGMTPGATSGFDINYKDGAGSDFVLYKALSLSAPISWTPVATNNVGTGSFNISTTEAAAFYKILSR